MEHDQFTLGKVRGRLHHRRFQRKGRFAKAFEQAHEAKVVKKEDLLIYITS
jgi:hypothetical protein